MKKENIINALHQFFFNKINEKNNNKYIIAILWNIYLLNNLQKYVIIGKNIHLSNKIKILGDTIEKFFQFFFSIPNIEKNFIENLNKDNIKQFLNKNYEQKKKEIEKYMEIINNQNDVSVKFIYIFFLFFLYLKENIKFLNKKRNKNSNYITLINYLNEIILDIIKIFKQNNQKNPAEVIVDFILDIHLNSYPFEKRIFMLEEEINKLKNKNKSNKK